MVEEFYPALVGIIVGGLVPLGIVVFYLYYTFKKRQLISEERKLAIEKGMEIPMEEPSQKKEFNPLRTLRWGMILLAVGLAFMVSYVIETDPGLIITGIIIGFIGLAQIIWYRIAAVKKQEDENSFE